MLNNEIFNYFLADCLNDSDCPYDKACFNKKCLNPCSVGHTQCGRGATCLAESHRANCICEPGTQGNPFISCVTGSCQYNEDCADHEACDRLNRVCRPVCETETCAELAKCIGRNHQPNCECKQGTSGNPYIQCLEEKHISPECNNDSECTSPFVCINQRCENPCLESNICAIDQICSVLDTRPLRTLICKCPTDMIINNDGKCKPLLQDQPECIKNDDCADTDQCIYGSCVDACNNQRCGINAQCSAKYHSAQCTCPANYIGNPHVECSIVVTSRSECETNSDCADDQSCNNHLCVNPCTNSQNCGRGAFCNAVKHRAVCKCPIGFNGNPEIQCIPPAADTKSCRSNSDCTQAEACVNQLCVNPCNCDDNADCFVSNHYPVCTCKTGYARNDNLVCQKLECETNTDCTQDKQCYNNKCVNPCALDNPCAINAECFGYNHLSNCRCFPGLEGNGYQKCQYVECHSDQECQSTQVCNLNSCVNPCEIKELNGCAQNAICSVRNHVTSCKCPQELPRGNPFSYCEDNPPIAKDEPQCVMDMHCPGSLACINSKCVDPCQALSPCPKTSKCSVLNSLPVRTMLCECPQFTVPDINGECKAIQFSTPVPMCSSDSECDDKEACINHQCRNPCNCGTQADCVVQNHHPICSCLEGFEGNPYRGCRTIGCKSNSECESTKACVNGNCINPCLLDNECGINAECTPIANRAECSCRAGYVGNPLVSCNAVECRSNSDCPTDKRCENTHCINPCLYENVCSPRAECKTSNHLAVCRCPDGLFGNPYIDCRPEVSVECKIDTDCPHKLACIDSKCQDPCIVLAPCQLPSRCEVVSPTASPMKTMLCICPEGYVSSGSGTCKPTEVLRDIGGCITDSDCSADTACINNVCRNPCTCGENAECRIKDHKPVCSCRQGFDGNPEIYCSAIGCRSDDECSLQHKCENKQCIKACTTDTCAPNADCVAVQHRALCQCKHGYSGDPNFCTLLECSSDPECPNDKSCINNKCVNPCLETVRCGKHEICSVYNHQAECACLSGYVGNINTGCTMLDDICHNDGDCSLQTACISGECVNPCNVTQPCGVNSVCKIYDTLPVRTLVCECLPGYQGNAAVQCDKRQQCQIDKGFVQDKDGNCVCPIGSTIDSYYGCVVCKIEKGYKIDEVGNCVCALERGMIIDERGSCICPIQYGYQLTERGECIRIDRPECENNSECADDKYCKLDTKTCEDPCTIKRCGTNALCNTTNHEAVCQCFTGYTGNPEESCSKIHSYNFYSNFISNDFFFHRSHKFPY